MPRNAEARLARLEKRKRWDHEVEWYRFGRNRLILLMCAEIHLAATAAGMDLAGIPVLRMGEEAEQALIAIGDTPEAWQADMEAADEKERIWARQHPGEARPQNGFLAEMDRIALRFADGSMPTNQDPLFVWYAWARKQPESPVST